MAAGEVLGEIWAVAGPGAAGPVDVRVFVRGVSNYHYGLDQTPKQLVAAGVPMSLLIIQNLGAVPIELGNGRDLQYGQGMRIAPNSILSGGAITPGGPGAAVVESYARAALPAVGNPGRLARLTDYDLGLWMDDGAQWRSLAGRAFDVTAFGAKGDGGVTDNGIAFNLARAAAVAAGGGIVLVPIADSFYGFTTLINLDDIITGGLSLIGVGHPNAAGRPELRWLGAAGSGPLLRLNSSHEISVKGMRFSYSSAAYDGDLVSMTWSGAAVDVAYARFEDCEFQGVGAATGARSLVRMAHSIIGTIRQCHFINAQVGVRMGDGSYTNVQQVENCTFNTCSDAPIRIGAGGFASQSITISGCTFEPRANGQAAGVIIDPTGFVFGFVFTGNWCGDVGTNGGASWLDLHVLGAFIAGNFLATAGAGAADAAIVVRAGSTGLSIMANYIETITLDFRGGVSTGILFTGNNAPGAVLNENNAAQLTYTGNSGNVANAGRQNATTFGFGAVDTTLAAPGGVFAGYLAAMPAAALAMCLVALLDAGFAPGGFTGGLGLVPSDGGSANAPVFLYSGNPRTERLRVGAVINAMAKIYPATDALALQVAAGLMAGNGVPNNANGANGDFYFNSAGAALTTIYQKRGGAWVGVV